MLTRSLYLRRLLAVTTALSMVAPLSPALAQDAGAPPARVGEIAALTGNVSFNGAGSNGQWIAATPNYPISAGDSVFTQPDAQAALAVDSSRINLSGNTELQMTALDNDTLAATESQGEIFLALNYLRPGESFVMTTPRGVVTISQNGSYDIQAGDAGTPTMVNVLAGAATVTDPGTVLQVQANQAAVLSGSGQTTAQIEPVQQDEFISAMLAQAAAAPPSYAPPVVQQMTGISQLGNYGSWNQNPQYGAVWYPSVSSGWTPYRDGSWQYVAPWGYTWVDSEPWGFAPSHYGRWIDDGGRWGWVPAYGGGAAYQPVYAPAVVGFFGAGLAVGLTVAALNHGNIGWVPLAPNEPYYPTYHCPPNYIRQINQVNVRNIDTVNIHNTTINNYNYAGLANARGATYMQADQMSRGGPVGHYGRAAPPTMLAAAHPVAPQNFHPAEPGQPAAMALPPPQVQHRAGAAPHPTEFAQRRQLPPVTTREPPPPGLAAHTGEAGLPPSHRPNAPAPLAEQHPGFAAAPGYHAPPPPPAGPHEAQPAPAMARQPAMPAPNHPQNRPSYAPETQPHPSAMQVHPQVQTYHPPAMPAYHPEAQPYHQPAMPAYHPEAQPSHPSQPAHQPAPNHPQAPRPEEKKPG